jgi:AraC-like DNA-binding protein/ligand-binding sensor protein
MKIEQNMRKAAMPGGEEQHAKKADQINRREIEPVLLQAQKMADIYEAATGCGVIILDSSGLPVDGAVKEVCFCRLCKQSCADFPKSKGKYYYLCVSAHLEAIKEAKPEGSSYVYACERGIAFWMSPFYSGGRYVGAFLAGKVRVAETHKRFRLAKGDPSLTEDINKYYEEIPLKSHSEIDALSRLLLSCAVSISESPEDPAPENLFSNFSQNGIQDRGREQAENECVYPFDRERVLLASLRRGDTDTARRILEELLDTVQQANSGSFDFIRFRAVELVVLLSRAAASGRGKDGAVLEANNRYLRRVEESKTIEELSENLHHIIDSLSEHIFSFQGVGHASALRRAERFIWANYTRRINLREVADASGLSSSYFSTIFKKEMGENLSVYLNRLRVEKAAMMLVETELPLTQIAETCGFENQSWFSRIFKHHTGISPGKYREKGGGMSELRTKINV